MVSRFFQHCGGVTIRATELCLAFVLCASVVGCGVASDDGYDSHLRYATRSDPVVLTVPANQPTTAPDPLKLDDFLSTLPGLGAKVVVPAEVPAAQRDQLKQSLDALFGTPAVPILPEGIAAVGSLSLDAETLAKGSASYRIRCSSCHGMAGDGKGISAGFPYPRDFRSGQFKRITGVAQNGKPRIADMQRVIRGGIPGTSMPLFDLLPDDNVDALAAYVIHLSIRGEVEATLIRQLHPDSEEDVADITATARVIAAKSHRQWLEAQPAGATHSQEVLAGETLAQSVRQGHVLFKANACLSCHEAYGKTTAYRYDVWGLPNKVQNLTQPEYHWGREPADLARHLRHGIKPANMPAVQLKDADIADLVNFLRALPFLAQLPADVRSEVERPATGRTP
jgi:mono/diheme cytochrome c family protein